MAKKKKKADEKPKKKKAAKPRDEEEDEDEEEEYSPEAAAKPKLDIYVGLSAITTLLLITAAVLFYMDANASKSQNPPAVSLTLGGLQGQQAAQPQPGPIRPGN